LPQQAHRPRLTFAKPAFLFLLVLLAGGLLYIFLPFAHAILLGIFLTIVLQPVHRLLKHLCFPGFPLIPSRTTPQGYEFSTPESSKKVLRWWRSTVAKIMLFKIKDLNPRTRHNGPHSPEDIELANDWHHNLSAIITLAVVLLLTIFALDLAWRTVRDQSMSFLKHNQALGNAMLTTAHTRSPATNVSKSALPQTSAAEAQSPSKLELRCNALEDRHRHNSLFQTFVIDKLEALLSDPDLDNILGQTVNKLTAQSIFSTSPQEQPATAPQASTTDEIELARQLSTEQEEERPQYVIYPFICKLQPHLQRLAINYLGYFSFLPKKLLNVGGIILGQGLALLGICFFLLSKGTYIRIFFRDIGFFDPDDFDELMDQVQKTSQSILWGGLGGAACQLLVIWGAYKIAGLPAGILTLMTAFCIAIPVVGTALVWIPSAYYLFSIGNPKLAIFLIIAGIFVSYIDNFIRPALMRILGTGKIKMPFGLIFFSLLGGLITFKFPGLIYGPMLAALFLTAIEIFKRRYNRDEGTAANTSEQRSTQGDLETNDAPAN